MDALARLLPVARPLLRDVDATLQARGVPGEHPVAGLLGTVGTATLHLLESVADLEPARLRDAGAVLRLQARTYGGSSLPTEGSWAGATAHHYAVAVAAFDEHLAGDGPSSMAARLRATASYVEDLARWQQDLRDDMAQQLARVLTSAEAVVLRVPRTGDAGALTASAAAAAEIATTLLRVAVQAADRARELVRAAGALDEAPYLPPSAPLAGHSGPISLS